MHRIFDKNGRLFEFEPESLVDDTNYVKELAQMCHVSTQAFTSAICRLVAQKPLDDQSGDDVLTVHWMDIVGEYAELFDVMGSLDLVNETIAHCLESGSEACLPCQRESPTNEIEATTESATSTASLNTALPAEASPVASIPEHAVSFPETAAAEVNDMFLWIRPLFKNWVLLSICSGGAYSLQRMDLIENMHSVRQLANDSMEARADAGSQRDIIRLATTLSDALPLNEQAYQLANGLCEYFGCDRVTVLEVNNSNALVLSVSGQPTFNRRSNSVRIGQQMVGRIVKTGEAFWFDGNYSELPDSLTTIIRSYTDETLVNSFALLPLKTMVAPVYPSKEEITQEAISRGSASQQKIVGAVLVEQIEDVLDPEMIGSRWQKVEHLVSNQFSKSRKFDSVFMIRFLTLLGRFTALYRGQTRRKAFAISGVLAVLILGALVIPADFKIRCEGYLKFEDTLEIYAQSDGSVQQLHAFDGKAVNKGDVLLIQSNVSLETEGMKLAGKMNALKIELEELNDSRITASLSPEDEENHRSHDLVKQIRKIEIELQQLQRQKTLIESEIDDLTISAPFDGTIAGWNVENRLFDRPVEKGTHLFSIIPATSKLKLDLRVPDQRAGYVQTAWRDAAMQEKRLPVFFRLASAPNIDRQAVVESVSPGLELDRHVGYTLPIEATPVDEIPTSEQKSKTAVIAKIVCGRKSFAYCKAYEVIDWIHARMFEFLH